MGKFDERGQAFLEAAITLPILILTLLTVIELGWVAYCDVSVASAINHAQYSLNVEDLGNGKSAEELIREKMYEASPVLKSGTLSIEDASIKSSTPVYDSRQLADSDFENYRFATKNEEVVRASVYAKIDYQPQAIVGALGELHFKRTMQATRIVDERFEIA